MTWTDTTQTITTSTGSRETAERSALRSDDGAIIALDYTNREHVLFLQYSRGHLRLDVAVTAYDTHLDPSPILTVYLKYALDDYRKRSGGAEPTELELSRFKSDCAAALPKWRQVAAPIPISEVVFE